MHSDDEHHVRFADTHRCIYLVLFCCFGERFKDIEVNRCKIWTGRGVNELEEEFENWGVFSQLNNLFKGRTSRWTEAFCTCFEIDFVNTEKDAVCRFIGDLSIG